MSIPKIPTNVPGFDLLTHGGIPAGRTTLITGKSGTCKSVLSLQISCNLARAGYKTMFVSVEEPPEDHVVSGDSLNFGTSKLVEKKALLLTDLTRPAEGPTFVAGSYDLTGLVHRVEAAVREGLRVVVLDSATALLSPRPPVEAARSHVFHLIHAFRRMGLTSILTAEAPDDYGPLTTLGVEDFVCDLVVINRNLVDGERRRRSVEIHKYRRSPHYKGEYPATITHNGLTIFPIDAQISVSGTASSGRYSSGLAGLDEMTGGGWLRDSIVLVRGPSGSGKTTLAGMYSAAGGLRGERVLYYGFEETKPILMRNFEQLGIPIAQLERDGKLKVVCRYPEATSPEDLLVDLRVGLNAFEPSLVVMDSISSIEHSTSHQGFRQFMIGMASLLREHGRSALLNQTIASGSGAEVEAPYLSTIADAILVLDYDTRAPGMHRTIRVLKMRGSNHAQEPMQLTILEGGLKVDKLSQEMIEHRAAQLRWPRG